MNSTRLTIAMVTLILVTSPALAPAADNLLGHGSSMSKFKGTPSIGASYKITIKAGKNGNPETFPLPTDPVTNGGSVSVARGGGVLFDPLTAGTWTGLGNPPGSKGWKYKNSGAPAGGAVKSLIIGTKAIKLSTKAMGTMPVPRSVNYSTETVISADNQRYCTLAVSPYYKELDGKLVKSKDQLAPSGCPVCQVGTDSDGDRLDNCYETDTGTFVDPTDAGTDPAVNDTDDDGIRDGDEVVGSGAGLELQAMGVNPLHKDILLEYDWFDDNSEPGSCSEHSHRPTDGALALVTTAFGNAPVNNPDGTTGINVIHDKGQGGIFTGGNLVDDANGVIDGGVNGGDFNTYRTANFDYNRNGYFHYVLMPHKYNTNSGSSGQAERPGNDMIVSLYCAHSDGNVGATIVHELGHNLNLRHGGFENCNYKPNYNSVMNYKYQFTGIDTDCDPPGNGLISYSIGDRIDLDETNLDESMGTCGAPAWDWNTNSMIEMSLMYDINPGEDSQPSACGGTLTTLEDYNDWSHVLLDQVSGGARAMTPEIVDCDNPAPLP